ncbi:MAG: glucose-1-phosphate cytidylyltransferase [Pseudomonadota bacterium]
MKVVILAGGLGTRISEETSVRPKPMVEIGGKPILWHIMKIYSHYGHNDFIICLGFKGYVIKEYFSNYFLHMSDVTFDITHNRMEVHQKHVEPWRITLVDTGMDSMTGGRIRRVASYVGKETFMLTYGDGVADIDINQLARFHRNHGGLATVTSSQMPGRFGTLTVGSSGLVSAFQEKPLGGGGWINSGFFVLEPKVFERIAGDEIRFEKEPMEGLARDHQLYAYQHSGFWQPMDTLRDKERLEELWGAEQAPWKVWSDPNKREIEA